jgi:hypothetical protein
MLNDAVTKPAHESKDMDRAIAQIVDTFQGMAWLIVERDTNRIMGAAYDMRDARSLCPANAMVKNVHTGRVVYIRAAA